jgi:hypothetical protein
MRQPRKRKLQLSRAGYHRAAHFSLRKPVQATERWHKLASITSSIIQTVCRPFFHIINHARQPLDFSLSNPATFPHTSLLPDLFLARLDPPPTRSFVPSAPTNTDLFRKSAKVANAGPCVSTMEKPRFWISASLEPATRLYISNTYEENPGCLASLASHHSWPRLNIRHE